MSAQLPAPGGFGRKQWNVVVGLALVVGYAVLVTLATKDAPSFVEFALAVGAILGIGNFAIAWEDRAKHTNGRS